MGHVCGKSLDLSFARSHEYRNNKAKVINTEQNRAILQNDDYKRAEVLRVGYARDPNFPH